MAVIGLVPFNAFLKVGWVRKNGSRREEVSLDALIAHIDHICQIAGDSLHAGIGSDFDGGFGLQSIPSELEFNCRPADDRLKPEGAWLQ